MGLNLRDSDINRPPEYASDLRNVEKNSEGELIQRWGIDDLSITWTDKADTPIAAKTIIDLWEYVGLGGDSRELLALVVDGLYRLEGSVFKEIPNCSTITPNWTVGTSPVEYTKVLYWNDADAAKDFATSEFLWKYDGIRICRAGSPEVKITPQHVAGSKYYRAYLETRDFRGNVTASAFTQFSGLADTGGWTIQEILDIHYNGFPQKFGETGVSIVLSSGSPTVTVITTTNGLPHHNFEAGDRILAAESGTGVMGSLTVESVTDTTITFTAASLGIKSWSFLTQLAIDRTYRVRIFQSDDEFFNYSEIGAIPEAPNNRDEDSTVAPIGPPSATATKLTEIYDDSYLRALPPKALYWTTFGNHLVCGHQVSGYSGNGIVAPFTSTSDNATLTDNIVWSDFPTSTNGATVETFNPDYVYPVGTSEDGPISALHGNDDSLAVHKEEQSYYVYGDFISATLRVRKAQTSSIGAAAHRSIEELEGGHLYLSERGVYVSEGGQTPVELSDIIEPLFRDNGVGNQNYTLKEAKSINDFYREKIYIYLPYSATTGGDILVYDYYYKEWFLHDNLNCDGGFVSINGAIYISDGASLYLRNLTSTKDAGSKIRSYYASGWFDLGEPILRKKWGKLHLISIGTTEWTPTVRTQCDWLDNDISDAEITPITDTVKVVDSDLPLIQSLSLRIIIENFAKREGFHITGYEIEFEATQTKPKGQS